MPSVPTATATAPNSFNFFLKTNKIKREETLWSRKGLELRIGKQTEILSNLVGFV